MLKTEQAAKQAYCTFHILTGRLQTCWGSQCMAWRWQDRKNPAGNDTARRGFCGLAGRPDTEDV